MWEDAVSSIMNGDWILGVFQLIMAVLISVVNLILYPISLLIESVFPDLSNGLAHIAQFYEYAATYMGWIINLFAVPAFAIMLIAAYWFFSFTATFAVWTVKLVVKWKQALW